MTELLITILDVRKAGMCCSGARRVCKQYDLDAKKLFTTGLPIKELEVINDYLIQKVVREARRGR